MNFAQTNVLRVAYEEHGPAGGLSNGRTDGPAAILLHGFPYDVRCYDEVAPLLAEQGFRVLVPYLRGYGPTRFLADSTPRSGQQAALAKDLLEFMDALSISKATLVGYDWGGRAACIVAALWPGRVQGLVTGEGYNLQDIAGAAVPQNPETEHRLWYQYYFHSPRGYAGLNSNRKALCALLWRLWSPTWHFDEATYARTAASFENPDFVDVVIHSYRHRFAYAPGDPRLESIEQALAKRPPISVPTISLTGADDGVTSPPRTTKPERDFSGTFETRSLAGVGHNIAQEAPSQTAQAAIDVAARA